jgi:signal transduction histidine kinase
MPFEKEKLGLILDDAIIICENKLKEFDIQLQYDHSLKSLDVNCNFTQLFQVFVNLISNSVDAIKNNSEKWIKIKVIESTDNVILHFIDSGFGIPNEVQNKIFSAFFTTKGRGVGSGLGLSLVVKILESHGGTIKILNDEKNTTFEIKIPRHFDK